MIILRIVPDWIHLRLADVLAFPFDYPLNKLLVSEPDHELKERDRTRIAKKLGFKRWKKMKNWEYFRSLMVLRHHMLLAHREFGFGQEKGDLIPPLVFMSNNRILDYIKKIQNRRDTRQLGLPEDSTTLEIIGAKERLRLGLVIDTPEDKSREVQRQWWIKEYGLPETATHEETLKAHYESAYDPV